jgi:hypothetical protein
MGQGTKSRRETAKALATSGLGTGGQEADPTDFCLRPHSLVMRLSPGVQLQLGAAVRLALGSPPRVIGEAGEIGVVDDPLAHGLMRCLLEGYRFVGIVDWIDLEEERVGVTVTGEEKG